VPALLAVVRDAARAGQHGLVHAGAWRGLGEHTAPDRTSHTMRAHTHGLRGWVWQFVPCTCVYAHAQHSHSHAHTVLDVFKARVVYGAEPLEPVRPAVVSALASYASRLPPHLQRDAADALAVLVRDADDAVRQAAAAGLVALRAREHAGAVEGLRYVCLCGRKRPMASLTHAHAHACVHTHARTYTHSRAHAHNLSLSLSLSLSLWHSLPLGP
jgi:hypothetical protein